MKFEFATATQIIFGTGTLKQVGPLAAEMGRRALVVTSSTARAKTLFDALCAPAGASQPQGSVANKSVHVVALEDKQFSSITVSADHHWAAKTDEDMVLMRVSTQETELDDAVSLGGQSFKTVRRNVY